jgi:ankyrin repeat protein
MSNEDKYSALLFASFKGSITNIEKLVALGADVHHRNTFGINVLHVAA